MSGLFAGILLSRTLAGFVATSAGWRAMYWLGVPLALAAGWLMASRLPRSKPASSLRYGELLLSLRDLWQEFPALRLAAVTQGLLFASFTSFWTILSLHLQEPTYGLGADAAGLFGVLGASGIIAAPIAGRISDRRGPHGIILVGSVLVLTSWAAFGSWHAIAGLVVGVILLDFGIQSVLISNQYVVYALRPEARSRLNTIFMGTMFAGGAIGSAAAGIAWRTGGWWYVSLLGAAFAAAASALQSLSLARRRRKSRRTAQNRIAS